MTGSARYALQKTREAVNCLALLEAPLRERLFDAAVALHILTADKIPEIGLHEKLESIISKVYDRATPDDHRLSHISDEDISKVAREIVELFEGCVVLYTQEADLIATE